MNFKVTDLLYVERRMPWVSRVLFERILLAIIVLEIKNVPDWLFKVVNVILCMEKIVNKRTDVDHVSNLLSLFLPSDPSILQKVEEALENENLSDAVFDQLLICLKEEWME